MKWFKSYCADFPAQGGAVVIALFLILLTGLIVAVLLALSKPFPDGYEGWLIFLAAIAGLNTGGMIGKRATDFRYKAAGASPVTVEGPSTVNVETATPRASTTVTTVKEEGPVG